MRWNGRRYEGAIFKAIWSICGRTKSQIRPLFVYQPAFFCMSLSTGTYLNRVPMKLMIGVTHRKSLVPGHDALGRRSHRGAVVCSINLTLLAQFICNSAPADRRCSLQDQK